MWIVPTLDELKDFPTGFVLITKSSSIDQFTLECREEAFAHRIVIAITDRTRRRSDTCVPASFSEGDRGVLGSLIGMMNDPFRPPLRDGHLKSREHQFSAKVRLHCPPDYSAAEYIDHHRQIEEPRPSRHIGYIGNPKSVRSVSSKVPIDQVRRRSRLQTSNRRLHSSPPRHADQTRVRHQSSDPFLAARSTRLLDIGENSRSSIGPSRETVDLPNPFKQNQVLFLAGRWFTLEPRIIAATRDLQRTALQLD